MEASTSSSSVWRLVLLIGAPLAFAVTGLLHLVPASGATAGSDFEHVIGHSTLWIGIHVVQLVIISLLAFAVAALTAGVDQPTARVSRAALVPFVAFYSAFDASVGLSGGLLARYVEEHPASRGQVNPAGEAVTDPLGQPVLAGIDLAAVAAWMLAIVAAAIAVRRSGVRMLGPVLLVVGAVIFAVDHAAPFGPIGMLVFAAAAVIIDRGQRPQMPAQPVAQPLVRGA
jgi:hypothetical protein